MQVFNIDECDPAYRAQLEAESDREFSEVRRQRAAHLRRERRILKSRRDDPWRQFVASRIGYFDSLTPEHAAEWDKPIVFERREAAKKQWADEQVVWNAYLKEQSQMPAPQLSVVSAEPLPDMIQSSGEFVEGFTPPDYLLDGVLQLRFCYSLTAQTGVGKTAVALLLSALVSDGRPLGKVETTKGTVLYLAGENPTDVQMRWLGLTQELQMDPRATDVHFLAGPKDLGQYAQAITDEVTRKGLKLSLVVIDTAAAYNQGDDENSNAQAGAFARQLRSLVNLPGEPCVLILCHPTKNAGDDALVPRGGGAFLAEVDGNIALRKRDALIEATNLGKFRGPDMVPLSFALQKVNHPKLKDTRGRPIPTVVARPVTEAEGASMKATARRHEDLVLKDVDGHRDASIRDRAHRLRWFYSSGSPDVSKVQRALDKLETEKLVRKVRDHYELTQTGERELNRLDLQARETTLTPMFPTVAPDATPPPPMLPPLPPA